MAKPTHAQMRELYNLRAKAVIQFDHGAKAVFDVLIRAIYQDKENTRKYYQSIIDSAAKLVDYSEKL